MSRSNDRQAEPVKPAPDASTETVGAPENVKPDPVGLTVFRALLQEGLRPRQAAILVIYMTEQPDLCADAMDVGEVRAWAQHFQRQNPHAWHSAMTGDMIRFVRVTGGNASEALPRYQSAATELVALAHAA
jgi:hypothetical protein